jgi:Flp pilus assembly protein CpaB
VSRRARAIAFLLVSLACAGLAAAVAGGYGRSVSEQLGELRSVVVASEDLPAREALTPRSVRSALELRRVPARFVPPGALASPAEAVGRAPATRIAAGSYVTASQLELPRSREHREPRIATAGSPIEIQVSGAGALAAAGGAEGRSVDVVVTSEPGPGGRGRTYVAAEGVELFALVEAGDAGSDSGLGAAALPTYVATLAVSREQALRLIQAENFARQVRLIPHGPEG